VPLPVPLPGPSPEPIAHPPRTPGPGGPRASRGSLAFGSIKWHTAQAILHATRSGGYALTLDECRAAYTAYRAAYGSASADGAGNDVALPDDRALHPPPPRTAQRLMTAVHQLLRAGVLEAAGRRRHLQFWHRAHPVPVRPGADIGPALVAAVEAAYARRKRAVSTREVTAELRAAHEAGELAADAYRATRHGLSTALRTLAGGYDNPRWPTHRSRTRWIVAIKTTTATGRASRWWLPLAAAVPVPVPAGSHEELPTDGTRDDDHRPSDAPPERDPEGSRTRPTARAGGSAQGTVPAGGAAPHPPHVSMPAAPHVIVPPAANSVEAIRRATIAAVDALRRPVSLQEAWWWAEGNAGRDPVARAAAPGAWSAQVLQALRRDAPLAGRPGRFVPVGSELTCYGGAPVRFLAFAGSAAADTHGLRRCRLVDILAALRAGDEVAELADLARRAGFAPGRDLGAWFADERRAALAANVRAAVCDERTAQDRLPGACGDAATLALLLEVVDAERRALDLLAEWAQSASIPYARRYYRWRLLARRRADLEAAIPALNGGVALHAAAPPDPGRARVDLATIAPLAAAAAAALGLTGDGAVGNLLMPARRFPNPLSSAPVAPAESRRNADGIARAGVDAAGVGARPVAPWRRRPGVVAAYERVDAVLACVDAVGPPRATALLTNARRVLGHTFRDATRVAAEAAAAPSPADRRALTLALGLLGDADGVARLAAGWDAHDPGAAATAALALVIADPAAAAHRLRVLDAAARGPAQAVTDRALARAERGLLLTVLE
jgi:hypothetical protein